MSTILNPIFVKCDLSIPDLLSVIFEEKRFEIGQTVEFYHTNKTNDQLFIGTYESCIIMSNFDLAYRMIFEKDNNFLKLKNAEVAAFILNDQVGWDAFGLIENGKIRRQASVLEIEIGHNYGEPIREEIGIDDAEIIDQEELDEIISDGIDPKALIEANKIVYAMDNVAKRFIGTGLMDFKEKIYLKEYIREV